MKGSLTSDTTASEIDAATAAEGRYQALPLKTVIWGEGSRFRIGEELDRLRKARALLITTKSLEAEGDLLRGLIGALQHRFCGLAQTVPAHVPLTSVLAIAEHARQSDIDVLVAFGGGSVIDAAKAVSHVLSNEQDRAPLVGAVPTTLSGAEFSHFFGMTEKDGAETFKRSFAEISATPALVVLDPAVTAATPEALWLSSGIKALDHAIEGLLCSPTPQITDTLALAGIQRMVRALSSPEWRAVPVRLEAQLAAWSCYFAAANVQFGLSHRIGHVLGGSFGVPHSLTSCITLAPVMEAFAAIDPQRLNTIAAALDQADSCAGHGSTDPWEAALRLRELVIRLRLPTRLQDIGFAQSKTLKVAALVAERYPAAAERLGPGWRQELPRLIEAMY